VVKPFVGRRRDGPSDGGVLAVRSGSVRGITVTHGICPRYGDHDTYDMAQCAVDEAVRAHVALGGDPEQMSALDNFCWPDPVESPATPDGARKLAQLVRACRGLADACLAYDLPLISGKDSMKNDARVAGRTISIRPTLLVSLMGIIPDVRRAMTTDFKSAGDLLYIVGETRGELGGSIYERRASYGLNSRGAGPGPDPLGGRLGGPFGRCPSVRLGAARASYRKLHRAIRRGIVRSCHDLADGGLAVALAESCLGGELGARVTLDSLPAAGRPEPAREPEPAQAPAHELAHEPARLLFCETPSRFLVSVAPAQRGRWLRAMSGTPCGLVGEVTVDRVLAIQARGRQVARLSIDELRAAWSAAGRLAQ
jgi:phosphoribosylformylglycinamidine (FGAM) synthase-like enzyme